MHSAWGIAMRESDYSLDLLSVLAAEQRKPVYSTHFGTAKAIELLRRYILEEIKGCNRRCSQRGYDHTGELAVHEYIEKMWASEGYIKQAPVTGETLLVLLREVQRIQDPDHEIYEAWIREETCQEWLAHIRALQERLEAHI